MHVTFVSLLKQNGSFRVFASSDAERDARSLLQMPSTRQLAATAVLAVTTAACLWMLMRKAKEPNFTENGIRYAREPNGVCQLRLSYFGRCPGHNL
jgi:hypothetical protein